jgi:bifunctional DNA-binding transcriptional regulator/antitoxin component of YhaV-PrlF toxin-antitoxin module
MSTIAKIAAKFQVTLPREVRRALKAKVGDLFLFTQQTNGSYRVQAIPPRLTEALRVAGKRLSPEDFRRVHRDFEQGWEDEGR